MDEKLKIIDINKDFKHAVELAEKTFSEGGVFVYPTDTIYGIGGNPFSAASQKITEIKGRDESKRYILLVPDIEILSHFAEISGNKPLRFLEGIWPNPVSVILNLNEETRKKLGSETAAFRIPKHNFCKTLLDTVKLPLISTSVNRSGFPPLNDTGRITEDFYNDVEFIFIEEKKQPSAASTIIDFTKASPVLIREGHIKFSAISKVFDDVFNKNFV